MEKHHVVEEIRRTSDHKEDQRGSNVNFSAARRDTRLRGQTLQHTSNNCSLEGDENHQQYSFLSFGGDKKILVKGVRSENNLVWLRRSVVGVAVDGINAEALQGIIIAEGFNDVVIRPMGGNLYLLTFSTKESMEDTLKNYSQFLNVWFKTVKIWGEFDVSNWRKTWISCYGLPLHLWSSENFSMIAQIWGKLISLDASTSGLSSFERVRMCILTDSMSSIVEEIIVEEGQGSHVVSIFEEGPLVTQRVYSNKENAMKTRVMQAQSTEEVHSKSGSHNSASAGAEKHIQTKVLVTSSENLAQQPELEFPGYDNNGHIDSRAIIGSRKAFTGGVSNSNSNLNDFVGSQGLHNGDALNFDAASSPIPDFNTQELVDSAVIPETPILPGLVLEIGPSVVPTPQQVDPCNTRSPVLECSEESRLELGPSPIKMQKKKKKGKKRLKKKGKNIKLGTHDRKRRSRVDFTKAIREYELSKTPNKVNQEDTEMVREDELDVEEGHTSTDPIDPKVEKVRSNLISADDLYEFAKKLGVPYVGDEVEVKKKLRDILKRGS